MRVFLTFYLDFCVEFGDFKQIFVFVILVFRWFTSILQFFLDWNWMIQHRTRWNYIKLTAIAVKKGITRLIGFFVEKLLFFFKWDSVYRGWRNGL